MLNKLRIKFITITMTILTVVLFIVYFCSTLVSNIRNNNEVYNILINTEICIDMTENVATARKEESNFDKMRIFSIVLDNDLSIKALNYDAEMFSEEKLIDLKDKILQSNEVNGSFDHVYYLMVNNSEKTIIVGIDRTIEDKWLYSTQSIVLLMLGIGWVVLLGVVILLSGFVTKPARDALIKQKQFISDASHELKTPLAVISANAQILNDEYKNNKWIGNIDVQTKRMSKLIIEMLDLTKLDEIKLPLHKTRFDVGNFIQSVALPFESVALENNKSMVISVRENEFVMEDKESLKKVLETIIENAIKHSNENGLIKIELKKINNKYEISVYNTGCKIDEKERYKVFDRFYKTDSSRKNDGSYGLGLAIVKRLTEINKWKLNLDCEYEKWTMFTIILNSNERNN